MTTVMGVDVGGTKTLAASVDRGGNLLTLCLESGLDPTASKKPKDDLGAVRQMRTRIRLLAQPESMHSIIGATQ